MPDTIFDKIIAGQIPAKVVHETPDILAFHDVNPQAPVHVLVIPKKKIERYANCRSWTASDAAAYFQGVAEVAEKLGLEEGGYRVVFNNGKLGGQEVEYLHAHILSGRQMTWPPG